MRDATWLKRGTFGDTRDRDNFYYNALRRLPAYTEMKPDDAEKALDAWKDDPKDDWDKRREELNAIRNAAK